MNAVAPDRINTTYQQYYFWLQPHQCTDAYSYKIGIGALEVHGRKHPGVIPVPRQAFLGDRIFVAKPIPGSNESLIEVRTPVITRLLPGAALVSTGLEDGEAFLITNIESVAEGSRVRIATDATAASGAKQ